MFVTGNKHGTESDGNRVAAWCRCNAYKHAMRLTKLTLLTFVRHIPYQTVHTTEQWHMLCSRGLHWLSVMTHDR